MSDISAGTSYIIVLIPVFQVRHVALLTISSGVSVGDDSSGEIMNQWPPVQTTAGANMYLRMSSQISCPVSQKFHLVHQQKWLLRKTLLKLYSNHNQSFALIKSLQVHCKGYL